MATQELRLTGSGGQGLILAGIILAEAALLDGMNVVQSQSYGPEARGGASKSEVIISKDEINYPKVDNCDIFLALTQDAFDEYSDSVKEGGIFILDTSIENKSKMNNDLNTYIVSIIDTAREKIGKAMVSNIVALGAICELTKVVSKRSLIEAVMIRVPRGTEELNKRALLEGFNLITSYISGA